MRLQIRTSRQVWQYTLMVSALAIAAPVLVVGGVMSAIPNMPRVAILFGVVLAFLIPLLIAPPLAFLFTSMLKLQADTIRRVDEHVRYDILTGAFNRSHFLDNIRARHASGVLMIVDADHFKAINDTLGHAAGDDVLCILARALADAVAPNGIVGRLGGEEFGIFLPATDMAVGAQTARHICRTIAGLDMIAAGHPVRLTVSIGAVLHRQHLTIGHSLKIADERLYSAKACGRNRAVTSDTDATPIPQRA